MRDIAAQHPALSSVLDFSRPDATAALTVVAATVTEFDSDDTGRGTFLVVAGSGEVLAPSPPG